MTTWFRRRYGAGPAHLLGHLLLFLVAGWAIAQILGGGFAINWVAWFIGAAILHDLLLLPLYSTLDGALGLTTGRYPPRNPVAVGARGIPAATSRPPLVNHLRVPAVIGGVLLLVYFPLILGLSRHNYFDDTGHHLVGYTRNWLLICAGLFLVSALVYGLRVIRRRTRRASRAR